MPNNIFSNREIAMILWLGVFLIWLLKSAAIRQSFITLIRLLKQPVILTVLVIACVYIGICISLLSHLGIWTLQNLKSSIIWSAGFAFISIVNISKIENEPRYFRLALKETFALMVFITFLLEAYPFSLIAEIILFPLISFATMIYVFSENKAEYAPAYKAMSTLLSIVGFVYLSHSIIAILQDMNGFVSVNNLREFIVPLFLSVLFLPFLYCLHIYQVYERVFAGLKWSIKDDKLSKHAKLLAVINFRANLDLLKRWKRLVSLERPKSRQNLKETFLEIKEIYKREKNPLVIASADGWSPYIIKKCLEADGIINDDYHRIGDKWFSSSRSLKAENEFSMNSITFYVEGNASAADELTLKLFIFDADASDTDILSEKFYRLTGKLLEEATTPQIVHQFANMRDKDRFEITASYYKVRLEKEDYTHSSRTSYERTFRVFCTKENTLQNSIILQ